MEGTDDAAAETEDNKLKHVSFSPENNFISVIYPGIVENDSKALETMGGLKNIEKAFQNPSRKLELKMRPADIYCKPVLASSSETTNLLLKVKRRRRKTPTAAAASTSSEENSSREENSEWKLDILGTVKSTYRFQGMADFQYLPIEKQSDGSYKDLTPDLVLKRYYPLKTWLKREDVPMFLPPMMFSRIDMSTEYLYRPPPKPRNTTGKELHLPHLIGTVRKKRTVFTLFCKYEDEKVPEGPAPGAVDTLRSFLKSTDIEDTVRELFDKQPVWAKNALIYKLKCSKDKLKCVLPMIAFYMTTGPWRALWIRFGYDPRKEPAAKIYQILDFRVRQRGAVDKVNIEGKRSVFQYNPPNSLRKPGSQTAKIQVSTLEADPPANADKSEGDIDDPLHQNDYTYIYRPDVLPPCRCMFYQLCNIHEEECQNLIHQNDGKETECTVKDGWCIPDIGNKCRTIMYGHLKKLDHREELPNLYPHPRVAKKDQSETAEESSTDEESMEYTSDGEVNEMQTELLDLL